MTVEESSGAFQIECAKFKKSGWFIHFVIQLFEDNIKILLNKTLEYLLPQVCWQLSEFQKHVSFFIRNNYSKDLKNSGVVKSMAQLESSTSFMLNEQQERKQKIYKLSHVKLYTPNIIINSTPFLISKHSFKKCRMVLSR